MDIMSNQALMNTMMADPEINRYIRAKDLQIDMILKYMPKLKEALNIKKDNVLSSDNFNKTFLNPTTKESTTVEEGEAFIIHPNEFALATTLEYVKIPDDLVARVEGRSSMGRLGVTMHVTAGFIDPGFEGKITLEISNIGAMPVALYPGQRVCQIVFETMTTPSEVPYGHPDRNSKYMGQTKPESSRVKLDYELKK